MPDSGYGMDELQGPRGDLASRVLAMPTDTNPKGDIFGGWIMSLMDMAGKKSATTVAHCRVVAVARDPHLFLPPGEMGEVRCLFPRTPKTWRLSITLFI